jgi:hypothetical protein
VHSDLIVLDLAQSILDTPNTPGGRNVPVKKITEYLAKTALAPAESVFDVLELLVPLDSVGQPGPAGCLGEPLDAVRQHALTPLQLWFARLEPTQSTCRADVDRFDFALLPANLALLDVGHSVAEVPEGLSLVPTSRRPV